MSQLKPSHYEILLPAILDLKFELVEQTHSGLKFTRAIDTHDHGLAFPLELEVEIGHILDAEGRFVSTFTRGVNNMNYIVGRRVVDVHDGIVTHTTTDAVLLHLRNWLNESVPAADVPTPEMLDKIKDINEQWLPDAFTAVLYREVNELSDEWCIRIVTTVMRHVVIEHLPLTIENFVCRMIANASKNWLDRGYNQAYEAIADREAQRAVTKVYEGSGIPKRDIPKNHRALMSSGVVPTAKDVKHFD